MKKITPAKSQAKNIIMIFCALLITSCANVESIVKTDEMNGHLTRGRYIEAEDAARRYITKLEQNNQDKTSIAYLRGLSFLIALNMIQGKNKEALDDIENTISIMKCEKESSLYCRLNYPMLLATKASIIAAMNKGEQDPTTIDKAIKLYDDIPSVLKGQPIPANFYMALNSYYTETKQYEKAIESINRGLGEIGFFGSIGDHGTVNRATRSHELARIYIKQGKIDLALNELNAVKDIETDNAPSLIKSRMTHYSLLAEAYIANGNVAKALDSSRKAISEVGKIIGSTDIWSLPVIKYSLDSQKAFGSYLNAAANSMPITDVLSQETFTAYQLIKHSSITSNIYAKDEYKANKPSADSLIIRKINDLKNEIDLIDFRVDNLRRKSSVNDIDIKAAIEKRRMLYQEYSSIKSKINSTSESLYSGKSISTQDIQGILKDDEVVAAFIFIDDDAYAWLVEKNKSKFYKLKTTSTQLEKMIENQKAHLDPTNPLINNFDITNSFKIYQALFPNNTISNSTKLLSIIPDGPLNSLPLSSLRTKPQGSITDDNWLINKTSISTSPSLAWWFANRTQSLDRRISLKPFLGIGNPVFSGNSNSRDITSRSIFSVRNSMRYTNLRDTNPQIADRDILKKLADLPETADELTQIENLLSSTNNKLLLGRDANERVIKSTDLSLFKIISFATHGIMSGEISGSDQSGLALTLPHKSTIEDDGYLSAEEIQKLNLDAEIVILSACNTASSSNEFKRDGYSGLVRSFFHAGARSVLATHWSVASKPTVDITVNFIKLLKSNPSIKKSAALRDSILSLKKSKEYNHPAFWAPFELVGE